MSCQINKIAYINDVEGVRETLLRDAVAKLDNTVAKDELPLQECLLSLSPSSDVLVLALGQTVVITHSKWNHQSSDSAKTKFSIAWSGSLTSDPTEYITSVICLPLTTLGRAVSGGVDWTCIAVGFTSGFIRFYTEMGSLLLEEQLHPDPLLTLKAHSPLPTNLESPSEELHVLYSTAICILPGFPLFSTLRSRRNYLAQAQARADCEPLPPPSTLTLRKFGFKDQDVINDSEFIGTTSVNTFDHLMTASICGGYSASYRSSAPQHNLTVATGKRPYLGFHYALEGGSAPVLSDVAMAMASSLATALGKIGSAGPMAWLRGKSPSSPNVQNHQDKPKGSAAEPAEVMTCRFALSDVMREGDNLVTSPNRALSVIADSMGRVILINNKKGIAVRMWKGYRDAQCGWIEVSEEKHLHSRSDKLRTRKNRAMLKTSLFLVIYAPKKGVIDIWGVQQGGKITTFSASKNGRLVYLNYGLLGTNDGTTILGNRPQYSCVFIDPLGGLREISVPFHYALSSKNGKRARDIHLFKKLKTFIREADFDEEKLITQIRSICSDLKTCEIRLQIIEMLMSSRHVTPDALLAAADCFITNLIQFEEDELEPAGKTLYRITIQLQKVIEFYKYVRPLFDKPPEYNTVASSCVPDTGDLANVLLSSEYEVDRILNLSRHLYQFEPIKSQKVTFKDDGELFLAFISSFDFGSQESIGLMKVNEDKKYQIASLIYQGWMYSSESTDGWEEAAQASNIRSKSLVELALIYWLKKLPGAPLQIELTRFTQLLHSICELDEDVSITSWWSDIRNILMASSRPFQALTAALACRTVEVSQQRRRDLIEEKDNERCEDWENISSDTCQFTLLIGNLEDVSLLNAVINQPITDAKQFYSLPYEKLDVSMAIVIAKGRGSISEIVARWLASSGVDPESLIEIEPEVPDKHPQIDVKLDEKHQTTDDPKLPSGETVKEESQRTVDYSAAQGDISEKMALLRQHFPYSLTSSVLLGNLCWEFVMFWSKDATQLDALDAAFSILKRIPSKNMRHGICCLLWNIHIKKRLETAAKLMNKLGKVPKERLCVQEVGLSDGELGRLLELCVSFLDVFLDSDVEGDSSEVLKFEEIWEGQIGSQPQPFAVLVLAQTPAWFDLVMLHFQLAQVLHMIAHFNIKTVKLMVNLFDSTSNQYFFQDITEKTVLAWHRDDKRDNMRLEFLSRVITASIEAISQRTDVEDASSADAVMWMSKCQTLAALWKIDKDKLRIHQVYQLYVNGFDRQAEEISMAVNNTENLATTLLPIAGRRMMNYMSQTPTLLEEVSRISPSLAQYLENLNVPSVIMSTSSHDATIELIRKLSRYLPEAHKDYHIAQLMLDATFIYEQS